LQWRVKVWQGALGVWGEPSSMPEEGQVEKVRRCFIHGDVQ
jgi:hypothetical protein